MLPLALFVTTAHAWEIKTNNDGQDLHWEIDAVPYYINPDGNHDLEADEIKEIVVESAEQWGEVEEVDVDLVYRGESDWAEVEYGDEVNLVYFEDSWPSDLSRSLLAVTYVWSVGEGEIVAFDMMVNTDDYVWTVEDGVDGNDLMNSVVHEFGHAMGLAHTQVAEATMYGTTYEGETQKRDLDWDDEQGLRALYSPYGPLDESPLCSSVPGGRSGVFFLAVSVGALIFLRRRSVPSCEQNGRLPGPPKGPWGRRLP